MKKFIFLSIIFLLSFGSFAQCNHYIKIDGNQVLADQDNSGLRLPYWLKATQTLAVDQNVYSISVMEFTVNGSALDFSQVINVTTIQTVPANKIWKIESISKAPIVNSSSNTTSWTNPGTYKWMVPSCVNYICVDVWGGGGAGGGGNAAANIGGGGGGGGAYGFGCFSVTPGAVYTITVANGNGSSSSSVGALISAGGGANGTGGASGGAGGAGGTSTAPTNVPGTVGDGGGSCTGGNGGVSGNSGKGGTGGPSGNGSPPGVAGDLYGGGGGGGGCWSGGGQSFGGGSGAGGRVNITSGASVSSSTKVPCVVMYLKAYNGTTPAACPSGWTQADYQLEYDYSTPNNVRTCMKCD